METFVQRALILEGPPVAIGEIAELKGDGLRCSEAISLDGGGDILDAPLNADQITEVVNTVSLIISTSGAAITLIQKIIALKGKFGGQKVIVRDATGKVKGAIGADCTDQQVQRIINE